MATVNSARPGTKRFLAIEIMNANASLPMVEVLALLVSGVPLKDTGEARAYYKHLLETKLAEGTGVTALPGTIKVKAEKPAKVATAKVKEKKATTAKLSKAERQKAMQPARSESDMAAIKAKNAAKMAAIAAARGNKLKDFVSTVTEQDKADLKAEMNADLQNDAPVIVPEFLNKEQVTEAVSV